VRRPARLERAGALTPRDRIWAAIRMFGRDHVFSVAELLLLSEQRADTVLTYLRGLERAGFVRPGAPQGTPPALKRRREFRHFALVRDVGVDAPRVNGEGRPVEQGSGREQMWRAMKALRTFDYRELAAAASTERHQVSPDEAQTYCRFLRLGGYLLRESHAKYGTNGTAERLRFIRSRNTGPRAPLVTAEKCVMDGNSGAIVYDPAPTTPALRATPPRAGGVKGPQ
jgi:hypothetical protein